MQAEEKVQQRNPAPGVDHDRLGLEAHGLIGAELDSVVARFGALQPEYSHQKDLQDLAQQHSQVCQRLQEIQQKAESLETAVQLQHLVSESDRHAKEGKGYISRNFQLQDCDPLF